MTHQPYHHRPGASTGPAPEPPLRPCWWPWMLAAVAFSAGVAAGATGS